MNKKKYILLSIILWLGSFFFLSCSGSTTPKSVITINGLSESNVIAVMGNNVSNFKASPTQYLKITLEDVPDNNTYYLHYRSKKLGTILNYTLCTTGSGVTSCIGNIGIKEFPVYESGIPGDTFNLSNNQTDVYSEIHSNFQPAVLLINKINVGVSIDSDKNAWYTYQCGLMSKSELPPAQKCLNNSYAANNLGVAYGCPINNDSIITKSVVGIYFPNKFGDGKYGITCTGIPIGENWVITAGHCMGSGHGFFAPGYQIYIKEGQAPLPIEIESSEIASMAINVESEYILKVAGDNSQCKNCQYYADFSLLKVRNYSFANPIPLVDSSLILSQYTQVWIAGYGMHNSDTFGVIRDGQLNYRDSYYDHIDNANPGVLYSIGSIPDKNDYSWKFDGNGDSGGPLFLMGADGRLYLLSTLTGGTYFDAASIQCKSAGVMVENASMIYWGDTIKSIINGTADPATYLVN
ncbi:MAG: Trypsin [Burkholderiales bacterium]|nr:Trypsin [Burkholderiales bacterium]